MTRATGNNAAETAADRPRKPRRKRPNWRQRATMLAATWATITVVWLLRLTCRIQIVHGARHLDGLLAESRTFIPCGWHQRIIISALFLRAQARRGLKLGFLISPSREGEFIARVARAHRTTTIRGSSSRTGKQALKDMMTSLRAGISPMLYGDGPRGPAGVFKPGAGILSSRSGAPLVPIGCAASRYWQLGSWDKGQIPKPFARITVAIGEPWTIGALEGPDHAARIAHEIGERINALDRIAMDAL